MTGRKINLPLHLTELSADTQGVCGSSIKPSIFWWNTCQTTMKYKQLEVLCWEKYMPLMCLELACCCFHMWSQVYVHNDRCMKTSESNYASGTVYISVITGHVCNSVTSLTNDIKTIPLENCIPGYRQGLNLHPREIKTTVSLPLDHLKLSLIKFSISVW